MMRAPTRPRHLDRGQCRPRRPRRGSAPSPPARGGPASSRAYSAVPKGRIRCRRCRYRRSAPRLSSATAVEVDDDDSGAHALRAHTRHPIAGRDTGDARTHPVDHADALHAEHGAEVRAGQVLLAEQADDLQRILVVQPDRPAPEPRPGRARCPGGASRAMPGRRAAPRMRQFEREVRPSGSVSGRGVVQRLEIAGQRCAPPVNAQAHAPAQHHLVVHVVQRRSPGHRQHFAHHARVGRPASTSTCRQRSAAVRCSSARRVPVNAAWSRRARSHVTGQGEGLLGDDNRR